MRDRIYGTHAICTFIVRISLIQISSGVKSCLEPIKTGCLLAPSTTWTTLVTVAMTSRFKVSSEATHILSLGLSNARENVFSSSEIRGVRQSGPDPGLMGQKNGLKIISGSLKNSTTYLATMDNSSWNVSRPVFLTLERQTQVNAHKIRTGWNAFPTSTEPFYSTQTGSCHRSGCAYPADRYPPPGPTVMYHVS